MFSLTLHREQNWPCAISATQLHRLKHQSEEVFGGLFRFVATAVSILLGI